MRSKPVNEGVFLALGRLFAYPVIWDVFRWGWKGTTALVLVCFCTYICFGMTLRLLLPRCRWIVRSVLWLSLLLWTPQVLLPAAWEFRTLRFWCLLAALPCFVLLLISTRRIPEANE
jgi:hypothetical protein